MRKHDQALRHTAMAIAMAIVAALVLQGVVPSGGKPNDGLQPDAPTPKAIAGYVFWPNGTVAKAAPMQVAIKNNNTGAVITVSLDQGTGAYSSNVVVDLNQIVYVSCLYSNMWGKAQVKYTGQVFLLCNITLAQFPFGPMPMTAAAGGSVTGYGGDVTLTVPAGALAADTVLYGIDALAGKPGSLGSITLLPSPLSFSSPATLSWSYAGLDIGLVPEGSLAIYTSNGGAWTKVPCYVDAMADQVVATVTHFSNFSLGGAFAFGNQTDLVNVYPGNGNAPILDLTVINSAGAADTLDYVNLLPDPTDLADIAGVSLWNDLDNDGSIGAGDSQLGATLPAGSANFTSLGLALPAGSSVDLLAAVDISLGAPAGHVIDLYVPAAGIGLASAGLLEQAIDPAGNATVAQELSDPHAVYGYVRNIFGALPNVWVNLTNNRTLATEYLTTDGLGRYEVNIGLMPGGYANFDGIFVQANDTLGQTGWNLTYVDIGLFGERCDIYIGNGPIAGNETPADGSTISDIYRNITVNITGGFGGADPATIVLEVEGANYTWGSPFLSFAGQTLAFDTSAAVGSWANGQAVNVTLWQADDTVGNPCQNAPYSWSFTVYLGPGPVAGNETPALGSAVTDAQIDITVNITGGTWGIDLATIVLEVEGVNYTWGDLNLTFTGDTLAFNTTRAVGAWTDGQAVNVTLWSADDGAGNPCQNVPFVWWFTVSLGVVQDAPDIRVHKAGADINITWAPVANATGYNIYRSAAVDGTGFNFSSPLGTSAGPWYTDAGALADGSNYSYVVRGASSSGEGPKSNIGWKLRKALLHNEPPNPSRNIISLPYFTDLTNALAFKNDIGAACTQVGMWDPANQVWLTYPFNNFAIIPGRGFMAFVSVNVTYTIVGSYDPDLVLNLQYNLPPSPSRNVISLPYHASIANALAFKNSVGPTCTQVGKWYAPSQVWLTYPFNNFGIEVGAGYMLFVNANTAWKCPVVNP